ncbi:RICIN domain-containing protein [Streptomyces uncialis]|uniref:RICIN domain-containing protein n=1 Tax=Streptomyces uncialis TaxID=1048205 RepID=UPI00386DE066|nr:RICIN domain-containing protein [Streptomyces uncialis]
MARFKDSDETHEAPDGELYIALASQPGLVWDMPRASTAAGTAPIVYTRNNGANQRWRFEVDHDSGVYTFFRIVNVHSGLALSVQPDRTITQQPPTGIGRPAGSHQLWAMGFPGSAGSSFDPARPAQPHPTGSTGIRLSMRNHQPVDVTPASSGTLIAFSRWETFEPGWTFIAAT